MSLTIGSSLSDNSKIENWIVALTSIAVFALILFPLSWIASFDLRIANAFNTDEVEFMIPMMDAFHRGDFEINRYDYGLLYYNIGQVLFRVYNWFYPLSESSGLIIMRSLSAVFLIANAYVLRAVAKRFFETSGLLIFGLSLLGSITMINYGTMVHPDVAQVFMVSVGVYFAARYTEDYQVKFLLLSTLFAGFAFATKFVGIALFPILVVLAVISRNNVLSWVPMYLRLIVIIVCCVVVSYVSNPYVIETYLEGEKTLVSEVLLLFKVVFFTTLSIASFCFVLLFLKKYHVHIGVSNFISILTLLYLLGIVFGVGFYIGSPQATDEYKFLNGLIYVAGLHSEGHWFRDDSGVYGWLMILLDSKVLYRPICLFGMIGIGLSLVLSKEKRIIQLPRIIPLMWIVMFCLVVVFRVKSHFSHYLIPIIPFVLLYLSTGIEALLKFIVRILNFEFLFSKLRLPVYITIIVVLFILAHHYKNDRIEKYENSPELASGNWLLSNVRDTVDISSDMYVYIPNRPNFRNKSYWGLSQDVLENDKPDYLIINWHLHQWFMNKRDVETYLHGKEVFLERHKLYTELIQNSLDGFELAKDFGKVKIFRAADN